MTSRPTATGVISRRRILAIGTAAVLGSLAFGKLAYARTPGQRELGFHNLHTGERLRTTYWADGDYVPGALADVDYLLRDFRTGDVKAIDVRLLDLLHVLRERLGSTEAYEVISGYRSPKTNKMLASQSNGVAKKSLHMKGLAVDVSLPGRQLGEVRQAAMALRLGGVGYYPKPGFVHLDVGRVRSW
jgi:uncharacterized protein YcbK (DUF882 family)